MSLVTLHFPPMCPYCDIVLMLWGRGGPTEMPQQLWHANGNDVNVVVVLRGELARCV